MFAGKIMPVANKKKRTENLYFRKDIVQSEVLVQLYVPATELTNGRCLAVLTNGRYQAVLTNGRCLAVLTNGRS